MKKIRMAVLLILMVSLLVGCSGGAYLGNDDDDSDEDKQESVDKTDKNDKEDEEDPEDPENPEDEILADLIASIGTEGVEVEIKEVIGGSGVNVYAQVPDYSQLFLAACKEADPTKALEIAIKNQNFTTVEYSGRVSATSQDGQAVYDPADVEELIHGFVERELIKAINAVTEQGGAAE
ncbi:MAG: hypothetical protein J6R82_06945 [Clostridia bacterium]|nr:hypothetical protein [Clostridia bacterium]